MSAVLTPAPYQKSRKLQWTISAALIVALLFLAAFIFLSFRWPLRRDAVVKALEQENMGKVSIGAFHATYFPRPGCRVEHVVFQHNPQAGTPPLITIETMTIEGSFTGLLAGHVKRVLAQGTKVLIPPLGSERFETPQRTAVVIDDLIADGAILEVASRAPANPPLKFTFHEFTLSHIGTNGPAVFKAKLSNPQPPGEISTSGSFGPWNPDDVGQTAVSGEYQFEHADLSVFGGIKGMLSSSGKFGGVLSSIAVDGATDVPLFAVTSSTHQVQLQTRFHAVVNGENGDTFLKSVTATFGKTVVWAQGSVAAKAGQGGKTAAIDLAAKEGRIQDLLLLFARTPSAPMSGIVNFKAKVSIPPGQRPFLKKVQLQGDFGIDAGSFTKSDMQAGVNSLSAGALGEKDHPTEKDESDPETVLSDLKGHVVLKDGTARFSNLSFSVPGALARMQGTYNLISGKVDLRGTLKTDSELSKTTHGIRSLMLKFLDPLFKRKHGNYIAPVKITGTYEHPSFGLDLSDRDDNKQPKH